MEKHGFEIGDKIIHWTYGPGKIIAINKNSKGEKYYSIVFPGLGKVVDVFDGGALVSDNDPKESNATSLEHILTGIMKRNEALQKTKTATEVEDKPEAVNHPSHYNVGKIEVIDFIEDKELGFNLGNAVKYIARCQHKAGGSRRIEDLKKAIWYCQRQISRWEKEEAAE